VAASSLEHRGDLTMLSHDVDRLAHFILTKRHVVALTGAGIRCALFPLTPSLLPLPSSSSLARRVGCPTTVVPMAPTPRAISQ